MARALLCTSLLLMGGCFSVEFADGTIACGEAGCPPGYQCAEDGTCRRSAAGADAAPDAAVDAGADAGTDADADAGPMPRCGSVTMLADDFEDGVEDDQWGNSYGDSSSKMETGGEAVFPVQPETWSAYVSTFDYDLTGAGVHAEVGEVSPGDEVYTYLGVGRVDDGPQTSARVIHRDGVVYAERKADGSSTIVGTPIGYEPAEHRFWQVREQDGVLYWEVSPDGQDWVELGSAPSFFDVTTVRPHFGLGTDLTEPPAGQARFDDFNGGVAEGQACPVTSVTEDFSDDALDAWAYVYTWSGCSLDFTGGQLRATIEGTSWSECQIRTRHGLDLTGRSTTLQVPEAAIDGIESYTYLDLIAANGDVIHLVTWEGSLYLAERIDGQNSNFDSVPYDAEAHRWWRLRESGGRIYGEVSPDGQDWTSYDLGEPSFDLRHVQIAFGAGASEAPAGGMVARFDDFNLPP